MATNKVNVKFDADGSGFHKTIRGIESSLGGLKGKLAAAFGSIGVAAIAHSILEFGDNIQTMANNWDVSTDSAQRFARATRNANIEAGAFQKTLGTLDKLMAQWKGGSLDENKKGLLKRLGLSENDFDAKPDELLFKALNNTKDMPREQVEGIFKQLGIKGKTAGQIVGNREDILNTDFPLVSEDTINQLDALGDAMSDLKTIVLVGLAPALVELVKNIVDGTKSITDGVTAFLNYHASMEQQAANDGVEARGFFGKAAAMITSGVSTVAGAVGLDSVEQFLDDRTNRFLYGKNYKRYEEKANQQATEAMEGNPFSQMIAQLQQNIFKPKDKRTSKYEREGIAPEKKEVPVNLGQLASNQFMQIGGFMGADVNYRIYRASEQHTTLLTRIASATEEMNDKLNSNNDSDEF